MSNAYVPHWTMGDRLAKARKHASIGVAEMALRIGTSRTTITNYESGRTEPSVSTVAAWADATGVDLTWIVNGGGSDAVTLRVPVAPAHDASWWLAAS